MLPESDLASALPLFLLLAVIGAGVLLMTQAARAGHGDVTLFLAAFVIRFAASLTLYEGGVVAVIGDEDAMEWVNGWQVKRYWDLYQVGITGLPVALLDAYASDVNRGYMFFLGAVYTIWDFADPGRLVAAVVNCFAGAMTVSLVYRAAFELFDRRVAVLAGWLACVFPSLIMWSAQTIKEPVVILLETLLTYLCIRMFRTPAVLAYVVYAAMIIGVLIPFRFYGAYLAAGIVAFTLFLRFAMAASASTRQTMTTIAVFAGSVVMIGVMIVFAQRESAFFDFQYFMKIKNYSAVAGGASVAQPFDASTPTGFGLATLFGAVHVLFAPLPWQWAGGSGRLAFTIPEVVAWWVIFVIGVWPGMRRVLRERFIEIQPVLLFLFAFVFLYSAMFGNIGLAFRQRAQLMPWLLLIAAAGLEERWRRRRSRAATTFVAVQERKVPA